MAGNMSTTNENNVINDEAGLEDYELTGSQKTAVSLALGVIGVLIIGCYVYMYMSSRIASWMRNNLRAQWSRRRLGNSGSTDDEDRLDIELNTRDDLGSTSAL